jgi:hypothetical protein
MSSSNTPLSYIIQHDLTQKRLAIPFVPWWPAVNCETLVTCETSELKFKQAQPRSKTQDKDASYYYYYYYFAFHFTILIQTSNAVQWQVVMLHSIKWLHSSLLPSVSSWLVLWQEQKCNSDK